MYLFISPLGIPEMYPEKPQGYYTQEEWDALRPAIPLTVDAARVAKDYEIQMVIEDNERKAWRSVIAEEHDITREINRLQEENRARKASLKTLKTVEEIQAVQPLEADMKQIVQRVRKNNH